MRIVFPLGSYVCVASLTRVRLYHKDQLDELARLCVSRLAHDIIKTGGRDVS